MTKTSPAVATIEQSHKPGRSHQPPRIYQLGQPDQRDPGDQVDQDDQRDQVVQYYGLTRDPFAELGDVFLLTPKIEKLLRLLNYLTRFSHKLIVVTADAGVGKTCVAEQFLQQVSSDRDYCQVNGLGDDSPVQMLREIAQQIGLAELQSATVAELCADIHKYAADLLEDRRTCLILIDDADLLGTSVLEVLHELVQPVAGEISPLHLVLFGRPQLEDNLREIDSLADDHHHVFHYQLSRFSFKECCQYLQICFSRAGDQTRIPFCKTDYMRIHQRSGGVPLDIVAEARLILADGVSRLVSNTPPPKWVLSAAVAFSLVAAVLVGTFLWQQRSEQQLLASRAVATDNKVLGKIERVGASIVPNGGQADSGDSEQARALLAVAPAESSEALDVASGVIVAEVPEEMLAEVTEQTIEADEEIVEAELAAATTDTRSVQQEILDVAAPEPVDSKPAGLAEAELPAVLIESPDLAAAGEEATPLPSGQQTLAPALPVTASHEDAYAGYSASEQAILEIPGGDFTLQLLGARTEQQILEFLAPHSGIEEYRYFQTELNGAPWYVVVYGNYPDWAAATTAGANLPKSLGVGQPWIRKLGGIQKTLRDRASSPQFTQH